ncbi:hypothetical protein FB451DRAFT_1300804 [Mycena latifolia]|nr:hypothetical protein FB451DRAFT_1300804 [Mycena latifolia]
MESERLPGQAEIFIICKVLVPSPGWRLCQMDDSQWCLDACPTCATVVTGTSLYCSVQCEPDREQESELDSSSPPWSHCNTARVSAWAFDCYKSSMAPAASSPCIFPSPSRRKLHLRKQYPTSWVTPDAPSHAPSYVSSPMSTSTAVESLVTSSTALTPPTSRRPVRSWASPSPAPPSYPLLTKANVYLFAESPAARPPTAPSSETSDRPLTPSDLWVSKVAGPGRSRPKQRRDDRPARTFHDGP